MPKADVRRDSDGLANVDDFFESSDVDEETLWQDDHQPSSTRQALRHQGEPCDERLLMHLDYGL